MKRAVITLLVLGLTIGSISGCGKANSNSENTEISTEVTTETTTDIVIESETESEEEILAMDVTLYKYEVETGKVAEYYVYDKEGRMINKYGYANDGSIAYIVEYDNYGNEVRRSENKAGIENVTRYEYTYNADGKKISGIKYENDVCIGNYEYQYDADNRLSEEIFSNIEDEREFSYEYEYHSDGRLWIKRFYLTEFESQETYSYDNKGNLVEVIGHNGDLIPFWEYYEYDEKNNIVLHNYWDGEKEEMSVYSYIKTSLSDSIKNGEEYELKTQIEQKPDDVKGYYAYVLAEYKFADRIPLFYINGIVHVNELIIRYGLGDSSLYYTLKDLNDDGVEELIIATGGSKYKGVCDIFTYDGNSVHKIVEEQERTHYWVCENGYIKRTGSGGATYNCINYYTLSKEGPMLLSVCSAKQEDGFYFETTLGREQVITAEEYDAFRNKYPECTSFEWIKMTSVNVQNE